MTVLQSSLQSQLLAEDKPVVYSNEQGDTCFSRCRFLFIQNGIQSSIGLMKDLMVMMMMMMYSIRFNSRKQDGMLRGWYMLSVKNIFRLCGLRTVFVISPFLPSPLSSPSFSPLMFHSLLIGLMKTGCNLTIPNMLSEIKLEVVEY